MSRDEGAARRRSAASGPASRGAQPVDAEVGRRIRRFRLRAGLTQKALAQAVGISFQQLQKYEGAVNRASASRLAAIARRLEVPVEAFFDGTPDTPSPVGSSPDGVRGQAAELLRAFSAITDADHRRAVLTLARTLARKTECEG